MCDLRDNRSFHLEQDELTDTLRRQPIDNPDRLSFDASIHDMSEAEKVTIEAQASAPARLTGPSTRYSRRRKTAKWPRALN